MPDRPQATAEPAAALLARIRRRHPEVAHGSGVLAVDHDGRKVWAKWRHTSQARVWHRLQRLLAAMLRLPMLRPTVAADGPGSLAREADRLRRFAALGIAAPRVLAGGGGLVALSDAGRQLRRVLRELPAPDRPRLLRAAVCALADLHAAGLSHGRPFLEDLAWDGSRIAFLDLEEEPTAVMPLAQAQARDVWLLLGNAARHMPGDEALLADLFTAYARGAPSAVRPELRRLVRRLRPLRALAERLPAPWAGSDLRGAIAANRVLEAALLPGAAQAVPALS